MTDEILINVGPRELRVALIEDERVVELEIRRLDKADLLGQIYLGRVERLAPGMEADLIVINLKSTPLIERRVHEAEDIWDTLFAQVILADDLIQPPRPHALGERTGGVFFEQGRGGLFCHHAPV